jgi:hypothetical protein
MKLNILNRKSIGKFSNQVGHGKVSNKKSHKRKKFSKYLVCYFVRLLLQLDFIDKFL